MSTDLIPRPQNRTIVRSEWRGSLASRLATALVPAALGAIAAMSPGIAARLATTLFFTTWGPRRAWVADGAEALRIDDPEGAIAAYRFSPLAAPRGTMLLVHGWNGRASQWRTWVDPLLADGWNVVAVDLPGHGASDGRSGDMPRFARALGAVERALGPIDAVVAHSMGAGALAIAWDEGLLHPARAVVIGPVERPDPWVERFIGWLSARWTSAIPSAMEQRVGRPMNELRMAPRWARIGGEVLVVHDADDREVPIAHGRAIAAATARGSRIETTGLGHVRIVADDEVRRRAIGFLATGVADTTRAPWWCGCGAPAERDGECEACAISRELYDPGQRAA